MRVKQKIMIGSLRINSMSNASILQIGSSGLIQTKVRDVTEYYAAPPPGENPPGGSLPPGGVPPTLPPTSNGPFLLPVPVSPKLFPTPEPPSQRQL